MKLMRWALILAACIVAFYVTLNFNIYFEEFKQIFFYTNDWMSYLMVMLLIIAIGGIFRWFVKQEIWITKKR